MNFLFLNFLKNQTNILKKEQNKTVKSESLIITPITSPSLTRGFLGGLASSDSTSASGSSDSSTASLSSTLSSATTSASEVDSALTTKDGFGSAATTGLKFHGIEGDETLEVEVGAPETNEEEGRRERNIENPSFLEGHCVGVIMRA